jgi:hypothetical protein
MENLPSYQFDYIKLVTQLGLYQVENDTSGELTRTILDFFQSSYADDLKQLDLSNLPDVPEALKSLEPPKNTYVATIHGIDELKYPPQVEIEAYSKKEAEELSNTDLKMGEWASVVLK